MAVKRKNRKGLATNIMCVLKHEGTAPTGYLARRFGFSDTAIDRVMDALERRGVVRYYSVMSRGYGLTDKGHRAVARSRACTSPGRFQTTRAYSDSRYVPIGRARRR